MHRPFLFLASLSGAIAVALGAFGAHGLKKIVSADAVATFQTGVQYQVYHTFALLIAGILFGTYPVKWIRWAGACFIVGIILFSGSLYLMTAFKANGTVGLDGIGIITPFGGLSFILGWLFLCVGVSRKK